MKEKIIALLNEENIPELSKELAIVKKLDLAKCDITDAQAKTLAEVLKTNKSISIVLLNNNNLGKEGIEYLIQALELNYTITNLNLYYNKYKDESQKTQIKEFLKRNELEKTAIEALKRKVEEEEKAEHQKNLMEQLEQAELEKEALEEQLAEIRQKTLQQKNELQNNIYELNAKILEKEEVFKAEIEDLQNQLLVNKQEYTTELNSLKEKHDSLYKEIEATKEEFKATVKVLDDEKNLLQIEKEAILHENNVLKNANQELKKTNDTLNYEIGQQESWKMIILEDNKYLTDKIIELESNKQELENLISSSREIDTLQINLDDLKNDKIIVAEHLADYNLSSELTLEATEKVSFLDARNNELENKLERFISPNLEDKLTDSISGNSYNSFSPVVSQKIENHTSDQALMGEGRVWWCEIL